MKKGNMKKTKKEKHEEEPGRGTAEGEKMRGKTKGISSSRTRLCIYDLCLIFLFFSFLFWWCGGKKGVTKGEVKRTRC